MNKMAVFVEGGTELEFDSKLIQEIASPRQITIESLKIKGGTTIKKKIERIGVMHTDGTGATSTHHILLFNCGNDNLTKERMRDEYGDLCKSGYTGIICHRDVAPGFTHAEIPTLRLGLPLFVKIDPIRVTFVLSVMEVEAWFLAEHTHFGRIAPTITVEAIKANLGFDPSVDDMQARPAPVDDLIRCYAIGGKLYDKYTNLTTTNAIDYVEIYCEVANRFPDLEVLRNTISDFLAT